MKKLLLLSIKITVLSSILIIFTIGLTKSTEFEGKIIKKIDIKGLSVISPNDVLDVMDTKIDSAYSSKTMNNDIGKIMKIGKIEKVNHWVENFEDGVILNIVCVEKPFVFLKPDKYEGKIIKDIKIYGINYYNSEDVIQEMVTTVGHPLRASILRNDIKVIFKELELANIEILIDEYKGGVRLKVFCKERKRIESIEFKGMDKFQVTEMSDMMLIKEDEVYRKDFLERSINQIKAKYDEEGYINSIITYEVKPGENENSLKIEIIVDEGEEISVKKISILGAKIFNPQFLIGLMETEEESFFASATYKSDIYEQDKGKIIAYYKENGYLDAQIIEDSSEYEWDDPQAKLGRVVYIVMKIEEGEQYYFDGYSVKIKPVNGKTVFKGEDFMKRFEQKNRGEIFNNTMFMKDKQMISFLYASKGYIFSRVVPKRTITEKDVVIDGAKVKRKFVKINFEITEGTQAYIETIIIKGNKKTKDKVIRRELIIKEGELFDSIKVQRSRERIFNLGFFKQVNFDVRPGSRQGYMNLIVDVEEQPSGTISLGGGYGTTSGFAIFADLAENNLLGNGQRVGIKFEYGPIRRSVTLSFNERWLFDYPIGFNASVFYQLYRITGDSIFSQSNETSLHEKQVIGYSLGLSYRFGYFYEVGTSWRHSFKTYINPSGNSTDEVFVSVARGEQEKRKQSIYIYRNSKNNYLNPTSGSKIGVNVGFVGDFLGGHDHFIEVSPQLNFYYSPFHIPFLKTHPLVFELRGNATFLLKPINSSSMTYNDNNPWVEYEDRMHMGGPETIRGWGYLDRDFPESWSSVGLYHRILYGLEFRIPIHPQMLWVAFFFDAGSLWTDKFWENQLSDENKETVQEDRGNGELHYINDFFKDNVNLLSYFRYSYGFGFRIQIPMMPLRFWFGKKVIYRDGAFREISDLQFQFAIGDWRF